MKEHLDTKQKALKINLNSAIYGTFAEIGAGQEVARHFFKAGAASGTIAKSMSAYDMAFSDAIYGAETKGRYVSESRLRKMLDKEYQLLLTRLTGEKYKKNTFFSFANTVTTINFTKTNEGHGWIGIKFQLKPDSEPNEILFHLRLLDTDVSLQQKAVGIIGTNLIYAAYYLNHDPQLMIESLVDDITSGSTEIDMINVSGPDFEGVNNILLNLYLVVKGFASAAVFGHENQVHQVQDLLYKKNVIIYRRRYGQKLPLHPDRMNSAIDFIIENSEMDESKVEVLTEITLNKDKTMNAIADNLDLDDVVEIVNDLLSRKRNVLVSNFARYNQLSRYLTRCKVLKIAMLLNINTLEDVFDNARCVEPEYGRYLLEYINSLFCLNLQVYTFPNYSLKGGNEIINIKNMPSAPNMRPLVDFLVLNKYIVDVPGYTEVDDLSR
jgi:hypothetical protein